MPPLNILHDKGLHSLGHKIIYSRSSRTVRIAGSNMDTSLVCKGVTDFRSPDYYVDLPWKKQRGLVLTDFAVILPTLGIVCSSMTFIQHMLEQILSQVTSRPLFPSWGMGAGTNAEPCLFSTHLTQATQPRKHVPIDHAKVTAPTWQHELLIHHWRCELAGVST